MPWTLLVWLACTGTTAPPTESESEETDAEWEVVASLGTEFEFTLDPDYIDAFYLLGNAYGAQSTWILLGDGIPLDDRDEDEPYRLVASDDGDWDDFWEYFLEADRDPVGIRLETPDDSEYRTFTDTQLGITEGMLDGYELTALELYKGPWETDEFSQDFVEFRYDVLGTPL